MCSKLHVGGEKSDFKEINTLKLMTAQAFRKGKDVCLLIQGTKSCSTFQTHLFLFILLSERIAGEVVRKVFYFQFYRISKTFFFIIENIIIKELSFYFFFISIKNGFQEDIIQWTLSPLEFYMSHKRRILFSFEK